MTREARIEAIDSVNKVLSRAENLDTVNIKKLNNLIATSDSIDYIKGKVTSLNIAFRIYYQANNYGKANEMIMQADQLIEKVDDPLLAGKIYRNLGFFNRRIKDDEAALKYLFSAAENFEHGNDSLNLALVNIDIASIFRSSGNPVMAMKYYRKAHAMVLLLKNTETLSVIVNSMGMVYGNMGKNDSAILYYQEAANLNVKAGKTLWYAYNLVNISEIEIITDSLQRAEESINKAQRILDSIQDPAGLPPLYLNLGELFVKMNKYPDARNSFSKAMELLGNGGSLAYQLELNKGLFTCNRYLKNYDDAFHFLDRYLILLDSSNRITNSQSLTGFEMKYNNQRFQKEQEFAHQKTRFIMYGSIIILALIIVILIIFFQKHRIKHKHDKLEKKMLADQLETRDRELASHVLNIVRMNERKISFIESLKKQLKFSTRENQQIIEKAIEAFETDQDQVMWKEFELRFTEVHKEFYQKLNSRFPDLSVGEKRICAFLLLDMTSKEICSITGQSARAVEQSRIRLRKHLGIANQDISLSNFLSSL